MHKNCRLMPAIASAISLILLALQCSDTFDSSTSFGRDIIDATDPSLLGATTRAFADSPSVLSAQSAPLQAESYVNTDSTMDTVLYDAGVHIDLGGRLAVGEWNDQVAIPYFEFLFNGNKFLDFYKNEKNSISKLSLVVTFTSIDKELSDQPFVVGYLNDSKKQNVLLDTTVAHLDTARQSKAYTVEIDDSIQVIKSGDTTYQYIHRVEFPFTDENALSVLERIKSKITDKDSSIGAYLAPPAGYPLQRIEYADVSRRAYLEIHSNDTTLKVGCIWADYSVFEIKKDERDMLRMSSTGSGRYTHYKLDIAPFWKSIDDISADKTYRTIAFAQIDLESQKIELESETDSQWVTFRYGLSTQNNVSQADFDTLSMWAYEDSTGTISLPVHDYLQSVISDEPETIHFWIGVWHRIEWADFTWENQPSLNLKAYALAP